MTIIRFMTRIPPEEEKARLPVMLDEIRTAEAEIARGEGIGADELRQLIEQRQQAESAE